MAQNKRIRLEFKPGLILDDTTTASEGGFVSADLIRFNRGRAQVIGGWEDTSATSLTKPARGGKAWATLAGDRLFAYGNADALFSYYGGTTYDITGLKYRGSVQDPFTTTNGSAIVRVLVTDHGLKDGDSVTFALADAVGGLTINGAYTITEVRSLDSFTITAGSNATSSATGGGRVEISATLDAGLVDGVGGTGYGTGTYGTGFWGIASGGDVYPRVWSIDSYGNNLVAVPRNGALYLWQPARSYPEVITGGDFAASTGWTTGTGWSIAAGVATATAGSASNLDQDVTGRMSGGVIYELTFTATRSAGEVQFQVVSADGPTTVSIGLAVNKAGTYTRRFSAPSNPITIRFSKDSAFAGTLDNVSIKIAPTATRIQSAPGYSIGGFVDPNRIMVLYGTLEADGDFSPMLVRWSNQEDITTWLPDDDNLAGEYSLARGSRIVGAIATRGQNIISTDEGVYSMRFTGNTGDVFQFELIGAGCGWIGKNAAVDVNGRVFWWGRDGNFYVFQGGTPQIIECPIRRDANDNLAAAQGEKVFCGSNPRYNEIVWFYADARTGNECNRAVVYNYVEGHWTTWTLDRTTWIENGVFDNAIGFSASGPIFFQERGATANGSTIQWNLTTAYTDIEDGNNLTAILGYERDFEEQVGNINLEILHRMSPTASPTTLGPFTITPTKEFQNFRLTGRQVAFKWSAGINAGFSRWGRIVVEAAPTSARR